MASVERRRKPQPVEYEYVVTFTEEEAKYLHKLTGRRFASEPNYGIYKALNRVINP